MKTLEIEWFHYDMHGQTCDRCSATGKTVKEVVQGMHFELAEKGINISFTETLLPEERMAESNMLLINGVSLETLLDDAESDENHCSSCSCLTGVETSCRTIEYEGETYEEIPEELIRKAINKAINLSSR